MCHMMERRVESMVAGKVSSPSHLRPDLPNTTAFKQKGMAFNPRGVIFSLSFFFNFGSYPFMEPQLRLR